MYVANILTYFFGWKDMISEFYFTVFLLLIYDIMAIVGNDLAPLVGRLLIRFYQNRGDWLSKNASTIILISQK